MPKHTLVLPKSLDFFDSQKLYIAFSGFIQKAEKTKPVDQNVLDPFGALLDMQING